jgi:5'(3')-deoxyribonucleotidase
MMRKIVLLDCDGVLADFTGAVCHWASVMFKREFSPSQVTQWDFCKALDLSDTETKQVKVLLSESDRFWPNLQPMDGAADAVRRLRMVADVYVVTSPWDSCPTWEYERKAWLQRVMGIPKADVLMGPAKHIVAGDVFVDDKPETVAQWNRDQGWFSEGGRSHAVLWDTPYNRRADEGFDLRTSAWSDVLALVEAL